MNIAKLTIAIMLAGALGACAAGPAPVDSGYGDYVAGQYARSIADTDKAFEYYYGALEHSPGNRAILQDAFSLAIMDGRFDTAIDLAERLKAADHPNAVASMVLSLEAFRTGNYDVALMNLEQAKGTGFDSLVSPLIRAWIEVARGGSDSALRALEPLGAISVFQEFRDAHVAYILDYLGRTEDAEAAYENVLAAGGNQLQPVLAYGAFLARQSRVDDARALYESYLERAPDNARLNRALAEVDAPEPAADPMASVSLALLQAATELSRDNARTPAILYARLATFLEPDMDDANLLLGSLFIAFEQPQTALASLEKIPDDGPLAEEARVREAIALDDLGRTDEALAMLRDYLDGRSESLAIRAALGDIYRTHERYDEALSEYERATALVDEPARANWFLYFSRGICYERLDRWPDAEADFLLALDLMPDEPQVLNYLGYSWIDQGMNIDRAKVMIEKAVEQRPNDGYIIDSLGWVQYLLGDYDAAARSLERATMLQPDDPTINDHLGDVYWMQGRRIEARFQWNHALALDPEPDEIAKIEDKIDFGLARAAEKQN